MNVSVDELIFLIGVRDAELFVVRKQLQVAEQRAQEAEQSAESQKTANLIIDQEVSRLKRIIASSGVDDSTDDTPLDHGGWRDAVEFQDRINAINAGYARAAKDASDAHPSEPKSSNTMSESLTSESV